MDTERFLKNRRDAAAKAATQQDRTNSSLPFLKLIQGKHQVRFLPKGNKQEGLPYKSVVVHTFKLRADGGGTIFVYAVCYNWLFSHENAKEFTIQPLIDMGKLAKPDIQAFKKFGCPACNARDVLRNGGESKEDYQACNVRGTNYWNVLMRSDSKIYVWSASDTQHNKITDDIEMYLDIDETTGQPGENAVDILDPKKGYDHIIEATGEKNNRRYNVKIKPGKPCPIGEVAEGERPLDLMVVVAESTKSYGEMCTLLRRMSGKLLASYGFDYGIVMPDERAKRETGLDDDDEEEEQVKKANKKTNPSSNLWDDDDEDNPKLKKSNSNDLKKKVQDLLEEEDDEEDVPVKKKDKINPHTGTKQTKAPWDEDDNEEDEEEEVIPVKKSKSQGKVQKSTQQLRVKPSIEDGEDEDLEDSDDDEDDVDFDEGVLIDKKTGKKIF